MQLTVPPRSEDVLHKVNSLAESSCYLHKAIVEQAWRRSCYVERYKKFLPTIVALLKSNDPTPPLDLNVQSFEPPTARTSDDGVFGDRKVNGEERVLWLPRGYVLQPVLLVE